MSVETLNHNLPDTATLWRYMKLSTLFMLLERQAFFPSVATLRKDDPLEGSLVPDATLLLTNLERIAADKMNELQEWLEKEANEAAGEHPEATLEGARLRTIFLARRYVGELAKRRAVWCWFQSLHESAAMWSVYGTGGIAVKTTVASLKSALPAQQDFLISLIKYVKRQTGQSTSNFDADALENQDLVHRPHLIKGDEFEHEHEVRVTATCLPCEKRLLVSRIDYSKLIEEVVISPVLHQEEAKAVEAQINRRFPNDSKPLIRRSSILGDFVPMDETTAALDDAWSKRNHPREEKLPAPLDVL